MHLRNVASLCLFFLLAGPLVAADGDLDGSFWGDGRFYLNITGNYQVSAVVAAPDEGVVVVGTLDPGDGPREWFWWSVSEQASSSMCHFFPPGGASEGHANAAAFDGAGRLLVAGSASYAGNRLAAARFFYPDCTLDDSFDDDGYWTLDLPGGIESVTALALKPASGTIALGGYQNNGVDTDMVAVLLNTSGDLITNFSGNGWLTLDPLGTGELDDYVSGIAFDNSGRVILAGTTFFESNGSNGDWVVVRFTLAGSLDSAFDGDGVKWVHFDLGGTSARQDVLYGMAHDPNAGELLLVGEAQSSTGYDLALARLLPSGALDPAFSGDGKVSLSLGTGRYRLEDVAVDGLGRILVAGFHDSSTGDADFLAMRYTANGAPDATFGFGGLSLIPFDVGPDVHDDDYGRALAIEAGRVVIAGEVENSAASESGVGIARLDAALVFADGFESGWFSLWRATTGEQ